MYEEPSHSLWARDQAQILYFENKNRKHALT